MTKDEALKLALEALKAKDTCGSSIREAKERAITACEQAFAAQPEQEPLGYIASMAANDLRASIYRDVTVYGEDLEDTVAIYTTSPQRTWVDLTEERIREIWLKGKDHGNDWKDVLALARDFEAEIKELNHE
jgi:hypothetical protein